MGTSSGRILKFNSNISMDTMDHVPNAKVYGILYGKSARD